MPSRNHAYLISFVKVLQSSRQQAQPSEKFNFTWIPGPFEKNLDSFEKGPFFILREFDEELMRTAEKVSH